MLLIAYCSRIQVYCYDQNVGGRHIIFPIVKQEAQLSQKGRATQRVVENSAKFQRRIIWRSLEI